jgi:hypothetical protein
MATEPNNDDTEVTVCNWCACNCRRTFIDVELPGGEGRSWSKVPLAKGWERVISGNSCPKGLLENVNEMRIVKAALEESKRVYPNITEMVRNDAFKTISYYLGKYSADITAKKKAAGLPGCPLSPAIRARAAEAQA